MSQSQSPALRPKSDNGVFFFISAATIGTFLWRVIVPASEMPLRMAQVSAMVFDTFMLAGLVALGLSGRSRHPVFWVALFAGIGLFLIRFTSNEAWWSGHLVYRLR